jgi:diamine N-acetyltransferase
MKEAAMATVQLRDIVSSGDRAAVLGLRRGPGQDRYLNSMEEIFAEADEEQRAMPHPWAVHDAQTGALVGFSMISDNIPEPIDDDLVGPYYLWKLLIDHRSQRRGYGAATLDAIVDYLRTGPAPTCSTPAARAGPAHRAGSTSATASPTPAGSCGARTSWRSTSRREGDGDRYFST